MNLFDCTIFHHGFRLLRLQVRGLSLVTGKTYPSPGHLKNKSAEDLVAALKVISQNILKSKAELILECVHDDGNTIRDYQASRDFQGILSPKALSGI